MSGDFRCKFCGAHLNNLMDVCNCEASRQERKRIRAANRMAPRGPSAPTMDWFTRQLSAPRPPAGETDAQSDPNELDAVFPDFCRPVARK